MRNPYFNLIKTVWQNGKQWHGIIIGYYLAFIVSQLFLSLSPYTFGETVDVLQNFTPARLHEVIFWLSAGVVLLLLFWLLHGPARVVERNIALKIQQNFRIQAYEKLTQLPLKWHQDHHSGNIITRLNRASVSLYRFAGEQFLYIQTIVKFVASMGFLLWISLPVGMLSLVTCIFAVTTVALFDRKLIPLYDTENEIDNHVGAVFFDYLSNMTTILTLRLGDLTRNNLFQRMLTVWPFFRKEAVLNEAKWFSMGLLLNSMQSIILIGYIIHALNTTGTIMIGIVVMIFRYQWDLSEVFYTLSNIYSDLVRMDTDVRGMQPLLDDFKAYAHQPQGMVVATQWHQFAIRDLSFHHQDEGRSALMFENLNLAVKRGENIALIGESGGGKSTLLNLLRGLYKPQSALLTIDNVEFNSLEPLQAITTLIPQDPEIFENTIEFNITMDVPADPSEVQHAIKLAGFSQVLATLPKGTATDIREKGLNLSVGQKQRLALARGLFAARYSSLILMDEPASSVDLPTEKIILGGVIDAFPNSTLIVSLHRLHLLPKFDRIVMLSEGRVIASGPTQELLNEPGPVADLWKKYKE